MKKILFVLTSILLCIGCITGFASDLKQSITKGDVTISYYQEGIKDKEGNRINRKSGNEFLKNTKEGIQVKTKNKTTLFYTPFSRHNREIAKKAGDTNTIDNEGDDLSMAIEMQGFLGFTEISPKGRYISYKIGGYERYDFQKFYMMDIRNGNHPLQRTIGGCADDEGQWQPSGERFFYVTNPDIGIQEVRYTGKNKFPNSLKLTTVFAIKKISFDKAYVYIESYKDAGCTDSLGTTVQKFKLSNLK